MKDFIDYTMIILCAIGAILVITVVYLNNHSYNAVVREPLVDGTYECRKPNSNANYLSWSLVAQRPA